MIKTAKIISVILFISIFWGTSNAKAQETASIYFFPTQGNYKVEEKINLTLAVNPNGSDYDTVFADLKFPADLLELQSFTFGEQYSVQSPDNVFNNSDGTFSYSAGIPGGINTNSIFGTITFNVKKSGAAVITLNSNSQILSSGENISNAQALSATFTLNNVVPKTTIQQNKTQVKPAPPKNLPTADTKSQTQDQNQNAEIAGILPAVVPVVYDLASNSENKNNVNFANIINWLALLLILILISSYIFFRKNIIKKKDIKKIFFTLLLAIIIFPFWQEAQAEDINSVSVEPARVNINLNPEEKILKTLLVVNKSNNLISLKVSVKDYKITDENGKAEFYFAESNSAVNWLIPQYIFMKIKPLDAQKIDFITVANKDMPGGGYNGAIIFELIENDSPVGSSFGTLIDFNVINEGITTGATINKFSMPIIQFTDPTKISFNVTNQSNSNLSLSGNIVLSNIFGKEVKKFDVRNLSLSPQVNRKFQYQWKDSPLFGLYKINANLENSMRTDNKIQSTTWFMFVPWNKAILPLSLILLLAIAIAVAYYVFIRSRKTKKNLLMQTDIFQN